MSGLEGHGREWEGPPKEETQDQLAPGRIRRISVKTPKEIVLQEMTLIWVDKAEPIYFLNFHKIFYLTHYIKNISTCWTPGGSGGSVC